jgi:(p)ppGpp synthase/HD superfamily hydrolase
MTVDDALALAKRLTRGHKDYYDRDYYVHDVEVMRLLPEPASDTERKAALLHSVLDLGAATAAQLREWGVDPEVVDIVELVTNGPAVRGYTAYVEKCRSIIASGNKSAMRVKLADMLANANHPTNNYRETIEIMKAGLARSA